MLTANLKFIKKKLSDFSFFVMFYIKNKHKEMSFVSNGGKFKLYTIPNCLLFQRLLFYLNARYIHRKCSKMNLDLNELVIAINQMQRIDKSYFNFKSTVDLYWMSQNSRNNSVGQCQITRM
jgi:hypothetical protein